MEQVTYIESITTVLAERLGEQWKVAITVTQKRGLSKDECEVVTATVEQFGDDFETTYNVVNNSLTTYMTKYGGDLFVARDAERKEEEQSGKKLVA